MSFAASADRLTDAGHHSSEQIQTQRDEVLVGHARVQQCATERRVELERALALEGLRRDAEELAGWMDEKRRLLEEARTPMEGKKASTKGQITRHAAFVAELAANRAELARLKSVSLNLKHN